jgi:hypothetical protein
VPRARPKPRPWSHAETDDYLTSDYFRTIEPVTIVSFLRPPFPLHCAKRAVEVWLEYTAADEVFPPSDPGKDPETLPEPPEPGNTKPRSPPALVPLALLVKLTALGSILPGAHLMVRVPPEVPDDDGGGH